MKLSNSGYTLPDCVMVARQTLTLFVRVRILIGQPNEPLSSMVGVFFLRGVAQFGRALRSGRRGRVFESRRLDQKTHGTPKGAVLFYCGVIREYRSNSPADCWAAAAGALQPIFLQSKNDARRYHVASTDFFQKILPCQSCVFYRKNRPKLPVIADCQKSILLLQTQ